MRRVTVRCFAGGTSSLALAAMAISPAWAGCTPYPTVESQTTHCTGANGDGILLDAAGATLTVDGGASVTGTTRAGIVVASRTATPAFYGNDLYLTVDGSVNGGAQPGTLVQNGTAFGETTVSGTRAHIVIGQGGSISGSTGLLLRQSTGNPIGAVYASLDNSGAITAASGPAIQTATGPSFFGRAGFLEIINRAAGSIGAIDSAVGALQNDGAIDGGTLSAIHGGVDGVIFNGSSTIPFGVTNHGTIASTSTTPTIDGQPMVVNDGMIVNRGTGPAIAADFISLTNAAGGVIEAASGTAISTGQLQLVNRGTIDGSITFVSPAFGAQPSSIDSVGGRIEGDVTLGDQDDIVLAALTDGLLDTGIAGRLDPGGGANIIQINAHQDLTLSAPIVLPAGFSTLALGFDSGTTITLASGFAAPSSPLVIRGDGPGTLVNDTDLMSSGPLLQFIYPGPTVSLTNNGSITSALAHSFYYAITLNPSNTVNAFVNNGSIVATGGGGVLLSGNTTFTNGGTITATDTAVSTFAVPVINNGTISSRSGVGLDLTQSSSQTTDRNNGLIEGATAGATIENDLFHNAGTIRSPNVGVALDYFGGIYNEAHGVISGGTNAITAPGTAFSQVTVVNAGTINGDVDLGSQAAPGPFNDSRNFYVALPGGVLNGNLALGSGGDTFITDLVNTGPGTHAGVTGTVTGNGFETIRYRVGADASVTLASDGGPFGSIGYEMSNAATLTLSANAPVSTSLLFAGSGTVDLTADVTQTDHPVISTAAAYSIGDESIVGSGDVAITSHGTLALARSAGSTSVFAAVQLGANDRFTNDGTIVASAVNPSIGTVSAIYGGASVTNNGTIRTAGGYGISQGFTAAQIENRGSILQIAGGADAVGIASSGNVTNSGTITTGSYAVQMGSDSSILSRLDNSGTIASANNIAIWSPYTGIAVINRPGGTITGGTGFDAISIATGGVVVNAGTINGDVSLASSRNFGVGSTYVDAGGRLNGDLTLGEGDDLFVAREGVTGVTGTVDAGEGIDTYIRSYSADTAATLGRRLPTTFEAEGIEALGNATVTLTATNNGLDGPLTLAGDGAIVNRANVTLASPGLDSLPAVTLVGRFDGGNGALEFTNEATITGRVGGTARSFANNGTILDIDDSSSSVGQEGFGGPTVNLVTPADQPFSFTNEGLIASASDRTNLPPFTLQHDAVSIQSPGFNTGFNGGTAEPQPASFTNGGTVAGGLSAFIAAPTIDFTNSGAISRAMPNTVALTLVQLLDAADPRTAALTLTNSGTISAAGERATALSTQVGRSGIVLGETPAPSTISVVNSGTISANGGGQAFAPAIALAMNAGAVSLSNKAAGLISATGDQSIAVGVIAFGGTFALDNAGTIRVGTAAGNGTTPPDINVAVKVVGDAPSTIRNSGTIRGAIVLGAGDDDVENSGTIDGDVFLGGGDDRFAMQGHAVLNGLVDGGDGANALFIDTTGNVAGNGFTLQHFSNFQALALSGTGTVTLDGALPFPTVQLMGGSIDIAPGTTLSTTSGTTITGGDLAERVVNRGTVSGLIALGGGGDSYAVYPGASAGGVDGGDGIDAIEIHSAGTDAAPTAFSSAGLTNFERLIQAEGVTSIGTERFQQVHVVGGRLIGRSGSVLTGNVSVSSGATFGSPGTVIGNVSVAGGGTLSPGASPGTMTVQGNVALAAGSNAIFEFTPAVSDKLLVSGTLSIGGNTTLNLVGNRPLTPGIALDLIVAEGGIEGSFGTTNKASNVLGFLLQTQNRLQLLGQFQTPAGTSAQTAAAIAYVNDVLVAGRGSPALLAAIPSLLSGDNTNAAAFAQLTPEAYASAAQLGVEHGLSIAEASRNGAAAAHAPDAGLYSFFQGLGDWRRLNGRVTTGVSRALSHSYGMLGGIGFGSGTASAGAFVGYIDSNQHIRGLGASTEADGMFAGVSGRVKAGGFDISALVAYDWSKADTRRAVPGGSARDDDYRLRSLVLDASIGYEFAIGEAWALRPQAGLTHVSTRRGRAIEDGSDAFALDVAGDRLKATFFDGTLGLRGGMAAGSTFHPWVKAGIRQQIDGRRPTATASFVGVASDFAVLGAARKATMATAGAGFAADVAKNVSLFGSVNGDFGGGHANNFNIGVRINF